MPPQEGKSDSQQIATTLIAGVKSVFEKMSSVAFSQDPEFKERDIIEYDSRWRVFGLEKFNSACYISVINLYKDATDQEVSKASEAYVLYLEEMNASKLLKAIGQADVDSEDPAAVMEKVGEFCVALAEQFKKDLLKLGFSDRVMSKPKNYMNDVLDGVEFKFEQNTYYELSFYLWKEKNFVIDIALGNT